MILPRRGEPVIIQGITGRYGSLHTKLMLQYGTKIAAGVTPGKGGESVEGVPVFNTVKEAVSMSHARSSVLFVPAQFFYDAAEEAFLWTLERCLGPSFTFEVRQAWAATYALLASAVQQAPAAVAA